ncbi:unnamed protein product [Caenorhabditis auriculariae]|uniref:MIF4G domain-containing protein n=1 Tax=Caenorhabditis auriculariae TaxID=2777116 RepID=A0A8S1HR16_9PELO|nr:unnamed protein product [Caenorhabditis auriculariae]
MAHNYQDSYESYNSGYQDFSNYSRPHRGGGNDQYHWSPAHQHQNQQRQAPQNNYGGYQHQQQPQQSYGQPHSQPHSQAHPQYRAQHQQYFSNVQPVSQSPGNLPHEHFSFNADAKPFVPIQQQQTEHVPPSYCNAPMYGMESYGPRYMYQSHPSYTSYAPPVMTDFYSENEEEQAAYNAMYAQFGQQQQQYQPSEELWNQMINSPNATLLQEVLVGFEQLMGESDEDGMTTWSSAIRQRLEGLQMSDESRRTAISLLLEMAVTFSPNELRGGNPQYTFATLLAYLGAEISTLTRNVVLNVLKDYHERRRSFEDEKKINLVLFFAEVYDKLTFENGSKIDMLGLALCDQIVDIVQQPKPNDASMKYLIRILKLTGASLDSFEASKTRIDEILTRMNAFAIGSPHLSESTKTQIAALVELRQKGWGRTVNRALSSSSAPYGSIVGADGQMLELSEEERLFLENQIGQLEDQEGEADVDDQEIDAEFGKFVKEEIERDAHLAYSDCYEVPIDPVPQEQNEQVDRNVADFDKLNLSDEPKKEAEEK